ncbi:signal transduction histidine kinase [Roseovarius sp. MBR-51]
MPQNKKQTPNHFRGSSNAIRGWFHVAPSPLAAIFTVIVIGVMFALGAFIIFEYRSLQVQSHGRVGSAYIDNLLAPLALSHFESGGNSGRSSEQAFSYVAEKNANLVMRVWTLEGALLYSTLKDDTADHHEAENLQVAIQGQFVVKLEMYGEVDPEFPLAYPYFEVYAPIHDPENGSLIAVGEIYLDASELLRDRTFVERATWAAVILAALSMLAMLALTFNQSSRLEALLAAERRMVSYNDRLRREANRARFDAAQANEQVLNLVGAELHDGPIQLLSLVSLMQGKHTPAEMPDGTSMRGLISQVMMELRSISAGLILPELEDLDAKGVVALAVERHKALMFGDVETAIVEPLAKLDLPRKICVYRVVCEGLSNAVRHSEGRIPLVKVCQSGSIMDIVIYGGKSQGAKSTPSVTPWHLGLQGMRRRLDAFGGSIDLAIAEDSSTLHVTLPVQSPDDKS